MTVHVDPVPTELLAPAGGRGDFLLELRSEEIPARMQAKAREDLARLFAAELAAAGLAAGEVVTYATPRRLALIARGLPDATEAVTEEVKGPKASAPPQALDGFLRKTGLTREQLVERDGVFFAVTERPGRATTEVLAAAIPAIIRAFPWPKSMRWGDASAFTESLRWVRPLQGIVALFGSEIVPVEIAGIISGAATVGHRFHHPGAITLGGADDYVEKLRACHVIVDPAERAALIRERAQALAAEAGLELITDEGLVAENAGLTEWPVPLLGRFDPAFLQVPPEVIQLTARVNQKYFVCRTPDGALANAFVCTANIDAIDGGARIVEGNRKVLAARLSDARFFYDQDRKVPLDEQAAKLDKIVFHEKLGTLADKVDRVAKLARWLVEEGIVHPAAETVTPTQGITGISPGQQRREGPTTAPTPEDALEIAPPVADAADPILAAAIAASTAEAMPLDQEEMASDARKRLADQAERAARLCKADLVTGMVGEFPELQGVMGGYYAAAQGEDPEVAAAIRDHYKPVGQGDEVPTAPVTVAVSLADKLDTLMQFYRIGIMPTGSKDPFALRRAAVAVIATLERANIRLPLGKIFFVEMLLPLMMHAGATVDRSSARASAIVKSAGRFLTDRGALEDALYLEERGTLKDRLTADVPVVLERIKALLDFFADRLKVQQREAGVRHDLIDAVFALGGEDDLVRLLARVHALQAFVTTEDGANLLAGYKRAANILKKEGWTPPEPAHPDAERGARDHQGVPETGEEDPLAVVEDPDFTQVVADYARERRQNSLSYTPEPDEDALMAALDAAEPRARGAVEREEFEAAMQALASLRAPIDAFFDTVTVNDPDPAKRAARLALLGRVRGAVHAVADFSRIEG